MITLSQITELALIGTPEATAQAKVLFELLNADTAQDFTDTAKAIDKVKGAAQTYAEKVAAHSAAKAAKAGKDTKAAKELITEVRKQNKAAKGKKFDALPGLNSMGKALEKSRAKKAKGKIGTGSKGNLGKASQTRNNHSKAKIAAYKAGKTVPQVIIQWFGKKKSLKTIAQISIGTGLSNKEVGDTCWGQVNKGIMVASGDGSYGMA